MRLPALATLALLAILGAAAAGEEGRSLQGGPSYEAGVGAVAGMTAKQAVYLKGSTPSRRRTLSGRHPGAAPGAHGLAGPSPATDAPAQE